MHESLLAPSAVIKKSCQWCSACVTTLQRYPHGARKHSSLPNGTHPRTRLVHRHIITLHEEKEKKQELCIRLCDEFLFVA